MKLRLIGERTMFLQHYVATVNLAQHLIERIDQQSQLVPARLDGTK